MFAKIKWIDITNAVLIDIIDISEAVVLQLYLKKTLAQVFSREF